MANKKCNSLFLDIFYLFHVVQLLFRDDESRHHFIREMRYLSHKPQMDSTSVRAEFDVTIAVVQGKADVDLVWEFIT